MGNQSGLTAVQEASNKWAMAMRNWKPALNRFMIEFEDRLADYIQPEQLQRNNYTLDFLLATQRYKSVLQH